MSDPIPKVLRYIVFGRTKCYEKKILNLSLMVALNCFRYLNWVEVLFSSFEYPWPRQLNCPSQ